MRGSITSRTGQMRTDSPGRAISSSALAMRGSCRTAASTPSRFTVSRPASYRVAGPKTMSVTGKVPISRRMRRSFQRHRGAPRLCRGVPNVWGLGGHVGAPMSLDRLLGLFGRHRIEARRAWNTSGSRPEPGGHDPHAERVVLLRAQRGITAHVLDGSAADDAVGARREREVVDGRDHPDRNSDSLDLF